MLTFTNEQGGSIVFDLIKAIRENKQHLSDIDGAIGDGDHGINMNKGFTICEERLGSNPGDLSHGLMVLGSILISEIGGSLGPLYGTLFRSMAKEINNTGEIGKDEFGRMITGAKERLMVLSDARPGDKTIMDVLFPAEEAYRAALRDGKSFRECLDDMARAARTGRDKTKEMIAAFGRASRLGERSRGVIDAGAASCCLILETLSEAIQKRLTVSG